MSVLDWDRSGDHAGVRRQQIFEMKQRHNATHSLVIFACTRVGLRLRSRSILPRRVSIMAESFIMHCFKEVSGGLRWRDR